MTPKELEDIADRMGALRNLGSLGGEGVARSQIKERLLWTDLPLLIVEVERLTACVTELRATVEMWEKTGETISHHIPEHYDGEGSFVGCLIEWAAHANEVVMKAHAWRKRGRLVQDGDRLNSAVERIYPSDYCI